MSARDTFERLHPDIIDSFLRTGHSDAISEEVQRYIVMLDRVPELQRAYPSISKCAKELVKRYPDFGIHEQYARSIIYDAINYFHINNTVRNQAWNNFYADRYEDLHQILIKSQKFTEAIRCLDRASALRQNNNENAIDVSKIRPIKHVLSTEVTAPMLGLREYNMKTIWVERQRRFDEAKQFINELDMISKEEKQRIIKEAALNLNITDAEIVAE